MGGRILQALTSGGFTGPVYPVHPHAAEIGGLPAFRSARELAAGRRSRRHRRPAGLRPAGRRRLRRGGREVARRHHGRIRGDRRRGTGAAGRARREGPRLRDAHGRPQLHGPAEHESGRAAERVVLAGLSAGGPRRAVVAERRARHRDPRARRRAAHGPFHVRERRQQGGRVGQRSARVLGRRPARRGSSSCISNRSATRAGSPASPGASRGASRSSR